MAVSDDRRGVGRPRSDEPGKARRGTTLFSEDEWQQIERALDKNGVAFSSWSRQLLLDEANRIDGGASGTRLRLVLPDEEAKRLAARAQRINYEKLSTMAEDVLLYLDSMPEKEFYKFALNKLMGGLLDEATEAADNEQALEDAQPLRKRA